MRELEIARAEGYCDALTDLRNGLLGWVPQYPEQDRHILEGVIKVIAEAHATMDLFRQVLVQKTLTEGADDGRVDSGT